jgi:heat-inducible transcriptional repressor
MEDLTQRQIQILKHLVEEYINTAQPVGSGVLEKKYGLGVSPATIRNEMAALAEKGYLRQPHTSSGRVPTPKALHFYINQLMEEKELSIAEEIAAKERLARARQDFDKMMHEATRALAEAVNSLAVAATEDGEVWHAGYSRILDIPEFYNIDVTSRVLSLLEEVQRIHELFFRYPKWESPVEVLFGEELGWPNFSPIGVVACQFQSPRGRGSLGVIGPARFNYSVVVPVVRYFGQLVSESTGGQP